ncbi:MAG: SPOR domain-containing protein [Burkholderiales bacterium]|nr:SPOR domain-containing protein [Burkholderiales bacterium]
MGLLSNLSRKKEPASGASASQAPADAVLQARTRARQRLIGAAVLVVIGVIGFPLVFETQPRPIPVDIPIVIPRKESAPPLAMPPARVPPAVVQSAPAEASAPALSSPPDQVITETREQAGKEVAPVPAARSPSTPVVAEKAASKPAAKPTPAEPAPKVAAETKPAKADDAVRAKALLEGTPPAAAATGRFVLQVGAFADASAARETRLKVEKLGLKTYTQVAETPAGSRIRVRVGPFASREEADKALAKARGAGLSGVVLTL